LLFNSGVMGNTNTAEATSPAGKNPDVAKEGGSTCSHDRESRDLIPTDFISNLGALKDGSRGEGELTHRPQGEKRETEES